MMPISQAVIRNYFPLVVCLSGVASGAPSTSPLRETEPIETGFVLYEGQYVPPPYILAWDNGILTINDLPMQLPRPGRLGRRPAGTGAQRRRPFFQMPPGRAADWVKRRLSQDSLLICWADQPALFLQRDQAIQAFNILLDETETEDKIQSLREVGPPWLPNAPWQFLASNFSGDEILLERLQNQTMHEEPYTSEAHKHEEAEEDDDWHGDRFISGLTLTGFGLSILALGTLLSSHYPSREKNARFNERQIFRLVGLIVVLNLYDLICTLFAHNIGGLWELNPFAGAMMDVSLMVVVYKLCLTIGPSIVLAVARRFRIAQLTAWWAGILYTVLILRWSTYNSMFLM